MTWEHWFQFAFGRCRRWYASQNTQDQDKICPNFRSPFFFGAVRAVRCQDRCQKLYLRIPSAPPHGTAVCLTGLTSCAVHLGSLVCFASHFLLSSVTQDPTNTTWNSGIVAIYNDFALFGRQWLRIFVIYLAAIRRNLKVIHVKWLNLWTKWKCKLWSYLV